ncbi:MFS transporter [Streptomyces sp. OE57]|uniref:MFS transporter n=1 Tax=Streptomyces lacaronensis TaxID=3379885 RepID=UPI0039B72CFC
MVRIAFARVVELHHDLGVIDDDGPARGRMFAAVAVAGGLGAAGGAVIGGAVTQGLGWRYVFLLSVPVALTAVVATPRLVPARTVTAHRELDLPGALLSVTGLSLLVFAITHTTASRPPSPVTAWGSAPSSAPSPPCAPAPPMPHAPARRSPATRLPSSWRRASPFPADRSSPARRPPRTSRHHPRKS